MKKTNFIKEELKKIGSFYLFEVSNMLIVIIEKFIRGVNKLIPIFPRTIFKRYIRGIVYLNSDFFTLRISLGCLGNCSFCNIKKAIGRLKSKPIPLILEELRKGLSSKQYKINIVASDTGSYGLDIGSNLPQLLNAILDEDERITIEFIEDLHPAWICRYKSELIKLIKTKRIKNIFTAIQSGSGRILKLMNRQVDLNEFKAIIKEMKKTNPYLRLRTQMIVGFPAETEQDFQETINFLKDCKFDEIDIFYYFEISTMDSAKIEPKVPREVMLERGKRIRNHLPTHICINYY